MTRIFINDDDTIQLGSRIFSYENGKSSDPVIINHFSYPEQDVIYKHGKENDTVEIKHGDIIIPKGDFLEECIVIFEELVPLYDIADALSKQTNDFINLTPTENKTAKNTCEKVLNNYTELLY